MNIKMRYFLLRVFYWISLTSFLGLSVAGWPACLAGLERIDRLGFNEESLAQIHQEIDAALHEPWSEHLNFSGIGNPTKINEVLRHLYFFLYPEAGLCGAVKNKDFLRASIKSIDLSDNELKTDPAYLYDFPDLEEVDLSRNDLFPWCRTRIAGQPAPGQPAPGQPVGSFFGGMPGKIRFVV